MMTPDELAADLAAIPHPRDPATETPDGAPFTITDDGAAEWALRKLAAHRAELATVQARADEEIARIDAWTKRHQARIDPHIDYFTDLLINYARQQRTEGRKTLDLIAGVVKTTASGGGWRVADEDVLVSWLDRVRPELVERAPRVLKAAANKVLRVAVDGQVVDEASGELVPGVVVEPSRVTVKIETETPK